MNIAVIATRPWLIGLSGLLSGGLTALILR